MPQEHPTIPSDVIDASVGWVFSVTQRKMAEAGIVDRHNLGVDATCELTERISPKIIRLLYVDHIPLTRVRSMLIETISGRAALVERAEKTFRGFIGAALKERQVTIEPSSMLSSKVDPENIVIDQVMENTGNRLILNLLMGNNVEGSAQEILELSLTNVLETPPILLEAEDVGPHHLFEDGEIATHFPGNEPEPLFRVKCVNT